MKNKKAARARTRTPRTLKDAIGQAAKSQNRPVTQADLQRAIEAAFNGGAAHGAVPASGATDAYIGGDRVTGHADTVATKQGFVGFLMMITGDLHAISNRAEDELLKVHDRVFGSVPPPRELRKAAMVRATLSRSEPRS